MDLRLGQTFEFPSLRFKTLMAISLLKVGWCLDVVVLGMCFVMVLLLMAAWLVLVCWVQWVVGLEVGAGMGCQVCG